MYATSSNAIIFYDSHTNREIKRYVPSEFGEPQCVVSQIAWSNCNKNLMHVTEVGVLTILDCKEFTAIKPVDNVEYCGDSISVANYPVNTSEIVGIGTDQGTVHIYNTINKSFQCTNFEPYPQSTRINLLAFNISGELLATAADSTIQIYDISCLRNTKSSKSSYNLIAENASSVCVYKNHNSLSSWTAMRCHPANEAIVGLGNSCGFAKLLDLRSNKFIYSKKCHQSNITGMAFSEQYRYSVTTGTDCKYVITDHICDMTVHSGHLPCSLTCCDISDANNTMVIGTATGLVFAYDLRFSHTPLSVIQGNNAPINCVRYMQESPYFRASPKDKPRDMLCVDSRQDCTFDQLELDKYGSNACPSEFVFTVSDEWKQGAVETIIDAPSVEDDGVDDSVKLAIAKHIDDTVLEFSSDMQTQMKDLQEFIRSEVDKVDRQMCEKWNLLISASGVVSCANEEFSATGDHA